MSSSELLPPAQGPLIVPALEERERPFLRLSLVIPTYDESDNLPALIAELDALLTPLLGGSYELIVVDDDSPDRTWQIALTLAVSHPCLKIIRRQHERGLSSAVLRGWQGSHGEILGVIDADRQHPPATLLALWQQIEQGADLALGSRYIEGGGVSDWRLSRRLLSRGAELLGLLLLPAVLGRVSDPLSGLFLIRRRCLTDLELEPAGYKILIELLARANIRWIGEVGYIFRERNEGASKVGAKVYLDYCRHLLRLRWATLPRSRFLRFSAVGAAGVLTDMALLYLLSDPRSLGLRLAWIPSKIIAAELAMVQNFLLNDAWTFADRVAYQPGCTRKLRRALGFIAICSAGLFLNLLLLNLLAKSGLNRYIANAVAIAVVTVWNYTLSSRLNWSKLVDSAPPNTQ